MKHKLFKVPTWVVMLAVGLMLSGCGSNLTSSTLNPPMPKTHHNKKETQHLYDTGQINYTEYCDMMQEIDPAWTPPPAAPAPTGN